MASFTGVGDNVELQMADKGEEVEISISGTYNMTIEFQREVGSPGSGAWVKLRSYSVEDATVLETYVTEQYNEKLRLIVIVDTSGTATATLTDTKLEDKDYLTVRDRLRNLEVSFDQGGIRFARGVSHGEPVLITAATTLTREHAGRDIVFNAAAGVTVTLPAATGTGDVFRFFVGVTVTSSADVIEVANATDEFLGNLFQIDTDTGDAIAAYPALDGDGFDTITLNGSTQGGLMGDFIEIVDVAAGKFALRGTLLATGAPITPLSAAV